MSNTSATGGYLLPEQSPAPLEGDALDDFFHDIVAGITGLDTNLVRPRWQETPPPAPKRGTNWAAVGVMNMLPNSTVTLLITAQERGRMKSSAMRG